MTDAATEQREAAARAALGLALCALCEGARYVCSTPTDDPRICPLCGGDGLARRPMAAVADAARADIEWLT